MTIEHRYCELRAPADGRVLEGVAVKYGDVATLPWGRERIEAGAFAPIGDVVANVQHDRGRAIARTGGGGLTIDDGEDAMSVRMVVPNTRDGDDVLTLVRERVLRALSIEFVSKRDRWDGDVRIIEAGRMVGVAVVDTGAYPQSVVAARMAAMRRRPTLPAYWL